MSLGSIEIFTHYTPACPFICHQWYALMSLLAQIIDILCLSFSSLKVPDSTTGQQ